ncbi:hypothetical protein [Streptomyces sp. NPDC058674]|uniref:hypothetical protein n=1 Tax=Streptomyces sp. NPDC058674 TaxID=3346592 RepID=UPI00365C9E29
MNRDRMSSPLWGPAVTLVVLGTVAAGCSTGGSEQPAPAAEPQKVPVAQVCTGLFPAAGGEALERVLGSTEFRIRDAQKNPGVRAVAQAMEDAYRAGARVRDMPEATCEVAGEPKGSRFATARVRFTAFSKNAADPADLPGVGARDPRVWTESKQLYLTYDCVSPRVGSTQAVPLQIRVLVHAQGGGNEGEAGPGQDQLTVIHSAALSVARDLGCANNAGLPEQAQNLPKPGTSVGP